MKPSTYYQALLDAIKQSQYWAGMLPPDEAAVHNQAHKELREEVLKRRRKELKPRKR